MIIITNLCVRHCQPITVHLSSFRTNKSLCAPIGLRPLPADYQPTVETLPGVTADESEQENASEEVDDEYKSADQLGAELVTLSLLPESRWKSLLHLDIIKVSPSLWRAGQKFFGLSSNQEAGTRGGGAYYCPYAE